MMTVAVAWAGLGHLEQMIEAARRDPVAEKCAQRERQSPEPDNFVGLAEAGLAFQAVAREY